MTLEEIFPDIIQGKNFRRKEWGEAIGDSWWNIKECKDWEISFGELLENDWEIETK